jgi:C-terminal processing protease CtpA/Prc
MKNKQIFKLAFISLFLSLFISLPGFAQIYNQNPTKEVQQLDKNAKTKIINKISKILKNNYIFLDKAKQMSDFLKSKLNNNEYDSITDGAVFGQVLTRDLQSVSSDKHLRVNFNPEYSARLKEMEEKNVNPEEEKEFVENMKYENFAFKKVERLDGNIGYIDFRNFAPSKYSKDVVAATMEFISNTNAVIIDMRYNGGGDPDGVRLICSYFFGDKSVHLNDLYYRPEDKTYEFWTLKKVDGKKMPDKDLYILTSSYTFSGAEEFTYNMKNLKRATIVGEVTGGGAHPGGTVRVDDNFVIFVPTGRAINPITKTNWEGTGVTPDVQVTQDKALETAQIMALEKISAKLEDPQQKNQITWQIEGLKAQMNPYMVDENTLKSFAGTYEDRTVTFENGKLYYQRTGRPKYELIPMAENIFRIKDLPYFRAKFSKDAEGKVTEFIGLYDDGHSDKSIRTN